MNADPQPEQMNPIDDTTTPWPPAPTPEEKTGSEQTIADLYEATANFKPWSFNTRMKRPIFVHKKGYISDRLITAWKDDRVEIGTYATVTYEELFREWLRQDGQPCGEYISDGKVPEPIAFHHQHAPAETGAFEEWWKGYLLDPSTGYSASEKEDHMREAFLAGQRSTTGASDELRESVRELLNELFAHIPDEDCQNPPVMEAIAKVQAALKGQRSVQSQGEEVPSDEAQRDWKAFCLELSKVWWWCSNNRAQLQHGPLEKTWTMFSIVLLDREDLGTVVFHDKTPTGAMEQAKESYAFKSTAPDIATRLENRETEIAELRTVIAAIEGARDEWKARAEGWEFKYDAANDSLEAAEAKLAVVEKALHDTEECLSEARAGENELRAQIAAAEKRLESGWVSVKERLPEIDQKVLIWSGSAVLSARFWNDGKFHECMEMMQWPATYWMPEPLPPLPQTEKPETAFTFDPKADGLWKEEKPDPLAEVENSPCVLCGGKGYIFADGSGICARCHGSGIRPSIAPADKPATEATAPTDSERIFALEQRMAKVEAMVQPDIKSACQQQENPVTLAPWQTS